MNSISSYILQKDLDRANEYLQRLSQLMRTILERSEESFTDITEETELLGLYLDTEAMRLSKKLEYEFHIDPNLDPEETLLPTMILQPFVENSIWHGISPKKIGGRVTIRFLRNKQGLLCEVEDDGVGRDYHKKRSIIIHKSKGLDITRRRLEILSEEQDNPAYFVINDLYDLEKRPVGTKIQLFLPMIQ